MNETIRNMTKLMFATCAIPCTMVILFFAIPVLIQAQPFALLQIEGSLFGVLFLMFLVVIGAFVLFWAFIELQDRWHLLKYHQHFEKKRMQHQQSQTQAQSRPPRYPTRH